MTAIARPRHTFVFLAALLAMGVLALLSIRFGAADISPGLIWRGLASNLHPGEQAHWHIFTHIRLPRALAALVVGGTLAVTGAVMQGLFRNPLVDPGIIGVMSGASFSAALFIVLGAKIFPGFIATFGNYALPFAAFCGGYLMTLALYRIARRGGHINIAAMLLIGIALGAFTGAFTGLLTYLANDNQLRSLTFWSMGSLATFNWEKLAILTAICAVSLPVLIADARILNALMLGEDAARHLGFNIERAKKRQIFLVALLVGSCVAFTGGIGFIGLVVPHIVRGLTGSNHRHVLPVSLCLGAALLVLADLIARTIAAPAELPIGILTAAFGAPFLAILVWKRLGSGGV